MSQQFRKIGQAITINFSGHRLHDELVHQKYPRGDRRFGKLSGQYFCDPVSPFRRGRETAISGGGSSRRFSSGLQLTKRFSVHSKAEVAAEDGRLADALALYQRMYEISPDDPAVISRLAALYLSSDDATAAVELLEAAASDEPAVKLRLGEALYAADRAEEGLAILEQVHDYYESSLKHASFVDNIEGMVARRDEARRLRDDVFADRNVAVAKISRLQLGPAVIVCIRLSCQANGEHYADQKFYPAFE